MHRCNPPVGADMHARAINAVPAAVGWPLDDAQHDGDAEIGRGLAHKAQMASLDLDSLIQIMGMDVFLQGRFEARAIRVLNPEGIARCQRFPEYNEAAILASSSKRRCSSARAYIMAASGRAPFRYARSNSCIDSSMRLAVLLR